MLWIAGLVALVTTGLTASFVRDRLIHHGLLDRPNFRSSHTSAVPRGGGVACLLGLLAGALAAALLGHSVPGNVIAAACVMAAVGLLDDRSNIAAWPRLVAQVATGAVLGMTLGGPIWAAIGAVAMPTLVNVVNFMDGINGITALTLGVWGLATAGVGNYSQASSLAALGCLAAGCALGFLPWNLPKARLFLGDVGSYLFGALAAGGILLGASRGVPAASIIAPLVIYLLDVAVTLLRRARRRAPLMQAHREHTYQRLTSSLGLSHTTAATWCALLALFSALIWRANIDALVQVVATLVIAGTYLYSIPIWRLFVTAPTPHTDTTRAAE